MGECFSDYANLQQILEEQSRCYDKRIGTVYGDFKVIDVWYDWQVRKQMWKMECTKCGKMKVTRNGQDYVKGKNKGHCTCGKELAKALKNSEKMKKAADRPDDPRWVGVIIGDWKVIEHTPKKGWLVECQKCGRQTYHPASRIKSQKQPLCTCVVAGNDWTDQKWIDKRFGHLVIQHHAGKGAVQCECDCGRIVTVKGAHLISGRQTTCGDECIYHGEKSRTHGLSNDRLYRIWKGMKQRCYNPKAAAYPTYGGRGIDICKEWRDNLFVFREWALSHGYSDDLSIDRIDNDKGYSPDNCRWATAEEQANNQHPRWTFASKRKYVRKKVKTWVIDGVEKSIQDWCAEYGLTVQAVLYRINVKGMTLKEALTTPKQQGVVLGQVIDK